MQTDKTNKKLSSFLTGTRRHRKTGLYCVCQRPPEGRFQKTRGHRVWANVAESEAHLLMTQCFWCHSCRWHERQKKQRVQTGPRQFLKKWEGCHAPDSRKPLVSGLPDQLFAQTPSPSPQKTTRDKSFFLPWCTDQAAMLCTQTLQSFIMLNGRFEALALRWEISRLRHRSVLAFTWLLKWGPKHAQCVHRHLIPSVLHPETYAYCSGPISGISNTAFILGGFQAFQVAVSER